jgi:hypothetical protein
VSCIWNGLEWPGFILRPKAQAHRFGQPVGPIDQVFFYGGKIN